MEFRIPRAALYVLGAIAVIGATVGITLAISGGGDNGDGEPVATVTTTTDTGATDEPSIDTAISENVEDESDDEEPPVMPPESTGRS